MSPVSAPPYACALLWSCLPLYTHALYPDFFPDCFKHGDAAVRLIVTAHLCSIFEIYIFCCEMCEYDCYTVFFVDADGKRELGDSQSSD